MDQLNIELKMIKALAKLLEKVSDIEARRRILIFLNSALVEDIEKGQAIAALEELDE